MRAFVAMAVAVSTLGMLSASIAVAQVKAPNKQQLKAQPRKAQFAPKAEASSPTDHQADELNEKWLSEFNKAAADKTSASSEASPTASGSAPAAHTGGEDERVSSVPNVTSPPGAAARTVVPGSLKVVKANALAGFSAKPGAAEQPSLKYLREAFGGFAGGAGKIEMVEARTGDGATRLVYASMSNGKTKQSYWWFTPLDQAEGWFDENGKRLGGTGLAEPKPDSRISSPFGNRRYYGRSRGAGFHNGIDFEGKVGEPIYAAADGIINHQGWYYQYGRTVKISHSDNFETLYAHMSSFADGIGPGSQVKKGDVIGYVGSTGRSTGPHLHFSTIVDGQFVDPMPYLSGSAAQSVLSGNSLVAYRKWQQDIHEAGSSRGRSSGSNPQL